MKTVAILGKGSIGLGLAAVLASKQIDVTLWDPSLPVGAPAAKHIISSGAVQGQFLGSAAREVGDALQGADVVILAVPGNGHRQVIDRLVPVLESHQAVIVSSQMSLSALYLSQRLRERDRDCLVAAWATTAITASRTGAYSVQISTIRSRVSMAAVPSDRNQEARQLCENLFGNVFQTLPNLLAVTLSNVNPPAHLASALCNLTRMEYGEDWGTYYGISGAVGRLIEAMDVERLRLAASFGLSVHTVQQHLHHSFDLPLGSVAEMAGEQNRRRKGGPAGPRKLDHRFVTEDVPLGIVPVIEIAKAAGVPMPLHQSGLTLISALYDRDFAAENDLLSCLDLTMLIGRQVASRK